MRMSANQLLSDVANDLLDIKSFPFTRNLSMHDYDEQKIAKFLPKMSVVLRARGFGNFIRFLDRRRQQRLVRLLAVPRTTAGRSKFGDNLYELFEVIRRCGAFTYHLSLRHSVAFLDPPERSMGAKF